MPNYTGTIQTPALVKPDLESDPTLTLFSRVNNPNIQKQMVDLLVKNEDAKVVENEQVFESVTDENGKTLFDEDYMPVRRTVTQLRYPNYVKKTRAQIAQEVQGRVSAITELGGEKNVVYLHPEGEDPNEGQAQFSPTNDEVVFNNKPQSMHGESGKFTAYEGATILAHEKGHQLRHSVGYGDTYVTNTLRDAIDYNGVSLTPRELGALSETPVGRSLAKGHMTADQALKDYFDGNEIAERMSQLKNYFGFKGNEPFTKEHLDYAKEHYVGDTLVDNNMSPFLRAITPEKEGAFINAMNTLGV